ncbi:MAG: U32 family peptidase C-terminal domain-containing protein [Candidatus Micrarchaeia archaeon]
MEEEVGKVTHYYDKLGVAIVELKGNLKVGDRIAIKGTSTNLEQVAQSMQIEHINIDEANNGDTIGLKVDKEVKEGDKVYKLL